MQVKDMNNAPSPLLITSTAQYWRGFAEGREDEKKFGEGAAQVPKRGEMRPDALKPAPMLGKFWTTRVPVGL